MNREETLNHAKGLTAYPQFISFKALIEEDISKALAILETAQDVDVIRNSQRKVQTLRAVLKIFA